MRRFFVFLGFLSLLFLLPAVAKRATQGFKVAKMELHFPNRPEWETVMDPSVGSILKQRFFYLDRGAQCYVFESEDRQFVIKFFRYNKAPQKKKVETLFNASKIAYDHLRDETALLYVHLNSSNQKLPVLKCVDPIGREIRISLDRVRFVIQKRGKGLLNSFEEALNNPDQMKRQIDGFFDLLVARAEKGVLNTDPSLGTNFGFIDGKAVEFDFGNYRSVPGLEVKKEVKRYTSQLEKWLHGRSPEWAAYLKNREKELK